MPSRVLITGAASGIGAATAAELRSRGAQVVGLDLDALVNCAGIGIPQSAAQRPDAARALYGKPASDLATSRFAPTPMTEDLLARVGR